jgi:hypothetical protein
MSGSEGNIRVDVGRGKLGSSRTAQHNAIQADVPSAPEKLSGFAVYLGLIDRHPRGDSQKSYCHHRDNPRTLDFSARETATMATQTMTMTEPKRRLAKDVNLPPENERFLRACSDIASTLVQEHEASQDPSKPKKDINLNSLRAKMSKKHKLSNIPPLTAIIAAIPEHYKKYILPKLIAKPIRKSLSFQAR